MTIIGLDYLCFSLYMAGLFWLIPPKYRPHFLLAVSTFFYALVDFKFIGILVGSILFDYQIGKAIARAAGKKCFYLLTLSLAVNLGILSAFKYFNFFMTSFASLLSLVGIGSLDMPYSHLLIPLGVSFYTFHSMSYVLDIYYKRITPSESLVNYACYVTFFPKLIAGPIERFHAFQGQWKNLAFRLELFKTAVPYFIFGVFLKRAVADNLKVFVDLFLQNQPGGLSAWIGVIGFSFQIYFDFLAYTLIARGISALFGIELQKNFLYPYFAKNPQDFWRRWHVSLSSWFRDYVYIPLGGNAQNRARNICLTMLAAGLWHGPSWNFFLWGGVHGGVLALNIPMNIVVTFIFVSFAWTLFYFTSPAQILGSFKGLLFLAPDLHREIAIPALEWILLLVIPIFFLEWLRLRRRFTPPDWLLYLGAGFAFLGILVLGNIQPAPFFYFRF
jgi:alginate O-acetyltransferase complex protein AlgI